VRRADPRSCRQPARPSAEGGIVTTKPKVIDHFTAAEQELEQADFWANKDGIIPDRRVHVDHYIALAGVHATLSLAQSMNERA
jgi:hypothetical protein